MNGCNPRALLMVMAAWIATPPAARAQWAVIDNAAILQLVQQVQTLQQELQTTRDQLLQARQTFLSTTGDRGMERLLSGSVRNYLPVDWPQVQALVTASGGSYAALATQVRGIISANAVLTAQRLSSLSADGQQEITAARQAAALQQTLTQQALAAASNRFAALQSLIGAIPGAADQKAVLDLQARMSAELAMLQNEQTKVQVMYQAAQAQQVADRLRAHEAAIAGRGEFARRLQPVP